MLEQQKKIAAARQALIDHGFQVNPALIAIVIDKGIDFLIPKKTKKAAAKKDPAEKSTTFNNYRKYAAEKNFSSPVTAVQFGNWLENGRNAGRNSAVITKLIGQMLQGKSVTWPKNQKGDYTIENSPYWLFCEMWRVGLVLPGYKPKAGYPSKKDFSTWKNSGHVLTAWDIFK